MPALKQNPIIKKAYENVSRALLPRHLTSNLNRNDRTGALHRAWGYIFSNHLRGAYYEFGVYFGESFRNSNRIYGDFAHWIKAQLNSPETWRPKLAAHYADYQHEFYAFDTFEGIPENEEGNVAFEKGNFACDLATFQRLNLNAGIKEGNRFRIFKGRFADVAKNRAQDVSQLQPAAIVNVDGDLYISAMEALEMVAPKLIQGSVLLMDDYHHFAARNDAGTRRAVKEFLEKHTDISFESWFAYEFVGQAFLVHKKESH